MMLNFYGKPIRATFISKAHKEAYEKAVQELEGAVGPFTLVLLFILTACAVTRDHLWEILDPAFPHSEILPDCLTADWMTDEARFLVALASAVSCETFADRAAKGALFPTVIDALAWADVLHEAYGDTDVEPEWP